MKRALATLACILAAIPPLAASAAEEPAGATLKPGVFAIDGDTLHAPEVGRIRLHGVSAPEMTAPFGPIARAWLDAIIAGRALACRFNGRDKHQRLIGRCETAQTAARRNLWRGLD